MEAVLEVLFGIRLYEFNRTNKMMKKLFILLSALGVAPAVIADETQAIDAIQEYMEFAEYSDGAISTAQLASVGAGEILFIDTRSADQYGSGHIHDARNIEWREVLARKDEIPTDKSVVLYCDTGLLSAKAHLALRLAGYENVKVLLGGYLAWSLEQSSKEIETKSEN